MKKVQLVILLFFFGGMVSAQETDKPVYTVRECISYALENSHDLRISEYEITNAENQIKEVVSMGLPQVNGFASFDDNLKLPTQMLPGEIIGQDGGQVPVQFGTKYIGAAGVQVDQLIFDKSFLIGMDAAKTSREYYELNRIMTEEDVIYHTVYNFYQTLYLQEELAIVELNIARMEKLEGIMRVRETYDLAREVDLNRVIVNKTNLETRRQNLLSSYDQQQNRLKFVMGMPVDNEFQLDRSTLDGFKEASIVGLFEDSPTLRTELQLIDKQIELNEFDKKNIEAGYYPTLSAYGNYSFQGQHNDFGEVWNSEWFNAASIGLKMQIPIFDGFQKKHRIAQSRVNESILNESRAKASSQISLEQRTAESKLQNSLTSFEAQKENIDLANRVYEQTGSLYKEGVAPLTDLLEAETSLREAQTGYNTEVIKIKLAELDLIKSNGNLRKLSE